MRYKQKPKESLDELVTRCRKKAKQCDFQLNELTERVLELVVASTPFEGFQKDLLDKPNGFTSDELLSEGRKYEAVAASKRCLQSLDGAASDTAVDAIRQPKRICSIAASPTRHADGQHTRILANLAAQKATGQNIAEKRSASNAKAGHTREHAASRARTADQVRVTQQATRVTVPIIGMWTT